MQKKLWAINLSCEFWQNLKKSISYLVRDLLLGRDVARIAAKIRNEGVQCSDSLIYAWANPNDIRIPNLEQFLLLVKHTENCEALKEIGQACGYIPVPRIEPLEAMAILLNALEAAA